MTDVNIRVSGVVEQRVAEIRIPGKQGPTSWATPAAWLTATAYTATAPKSVVTINGGSYVCLVSHTSGVFATDLAAVKWLLIAQKGDDGENPVGALLSPNNLSDVADASESLINLGGASTSYVDAAVAAVIGGGSGVPANGVVTGLGIAYTGTALDWAMSAGSANINGELITAVAQTLSLAAADATHPRLDAFYLDDAGVFGKITGTAAANPSLPTVDPTSQLYLGFALVPATATDLTSTITTESIYTEGAEWVGATSGSGFTLDSTSNPLSGTKCVEGTAVDAGAYVKFTDASPTTALSGEGTLLISLRSKAAWSSRRSLSLQAFTSGAAVGAAVVIKEGAFGFSSTNTSSYQSFAIPKSLFAVPTSTVVTEFRITAKGSGSTHGFYIDDIKLQSISAGSGGGGTTASGITQDQADARYLKLSGGTLSGNLTVPAEAYGAGWNGDNTVPTKNDVYDKIEAVVAGGGYTAEDAQDAVGGIVDATLIYVDGTPVLKRAPITGHITIADGSNAAALGSFTKAQLDVAVFDGNVLYSGDVTQYTDELAQDAVGTMVDGTLTYTDATPLLRVTQETKAADIASASTVNIGAAVGGFMHVTGTTTITAFDTVTTGTERTLKFDGILTLTHNATSLVLPGAANITTAAGDTAIFRSEGSGNWRCISYMKATGGPVVNVARAPSIQSVASSATVTPTFADDQVNITAQAAALNLANPTGTAVDGWGIAIRIKDNGTARAIAYNGGSGSQYRAIGVTLPTTTVISKTLYLGMVFNNADTKWDVVAVAQEA